MATAATPIPSDPGDWVDSVDLARPAYAGCAAESSSWHGTAIAGMLVATANNGQGGASTNWPGRVLAVRVAAKCGADVADIVDGMRWAAGLPVCRSSDAFGTCTEFLPNNPNPARVINISFGGSGDCSPYQGAINELRGMGVVVVAAAGNEYAATPTRPAKCPGVIGVAALNRDGFKSTYSNFGSTLAVATVGGDDPDGAWGNRVADSGVLSVGNFGDTAPGTSGYFNYFGTSFSTPIVAGAVSLMLAVNPALTAAQIEQGLRVSARPHVKSSLPGVEDVQRRQPGALPVHHQHLRRRHPRRAAGAGLRQRAGQLRGAGAAAGRDQHRPAARRRCGRPRPPVQHPHATTQQR